MEDEKENLSNADLSSCKLSSGRPVRNTKRHNYLLLNKGTTEIKTDCVKEPSKIGNKSKNQITEMAEKNDTKMPKKKPLKKPNGQKEKGQKAVNHNPKAPKDLSDEIAPHLESELDQHKGQKVMAKKVKVIYNPKIVHTITDHIDITDEIDLHPPSPKKKDESNTNLKTGKKKNHKDTIISDKLTNETNSVEERSVRNSKRLPCFQINTGTNQNQQHKTASTEIKKDEEDSSTYSPKKKIKSSSKHIVKKTKTVFEEPTNFESVPDIVEKLDDKDNNTRKINSNEINNSTTTTIHRKLRDRGNNNNAIMEVKDKERSQCCSKGPDEVLKNRACREKDDISEESGSGEESKTELKVQKDCIVKLSTFFNINKINFKPRSPTRADGNCWFRSILDQLQLHQVPNQPTTHKQLRIEVSNFLNHLPDNIAQEMIEVIFKGRKKSLKDLSYRQKKLGQFVDDNGIMVIATGLFVGRWIHVHREDLDGVHRKLQIEGGEGSENLAPLTVFYFKEEQHYQSICKTD